jgi:hypothetical protein
MSGIGVEAAPSPRGLRRFTIKPSGYLVEPPNQDRRLDERRRDPSVSRSFEVGDTRHDRGACVGRTRRPDGCTAVRMKTSCVDQNVPVMACIVSPSVGELRF